MSNSPRRVAALLALVALGTVGLLVMPGARAEDGPAPPRNVRTWVYDVRVVRVDATDPAVLEVAPAWQPAGAAGATTTTAWTDLLTGLKARGRTRILLDQRVTTVGEVPTEFKQERRHSVLVLQDWTSTVPQAGPTDLTRRTVAYVATGASGQLTPTSEGLQYRVEVLWDEVPATDGSAPTGSASWKGSCSNVTAGGTLVLSHREQISGKDAPQGIEIYVFVTGWLVAAK